MGQKFDEVSVCVVPQKRITKRNARQVIVPTAMDDGEGKGFDRDLVREAVISPPFPRISLLPCSIHLSLLYTLHTRKSIIEKDGVR
jgi:hypothetical protein